MAAGLLSLCPMRKRVFGPRDHALRWELFWLTPGVLRMTGSTAALVSLEESSGLLPERAGVEGAQQVEPAAEALGTERADEERGKEGPSSPDHVPGNGRHRSAHACGGSRRPHGQTAGWLREDPRGQGGHCVDRRIPRRGRTPLRDPGSVTDAAAMESAAAADLNPDRSDFAERVPPRSHAGAASPQPRVAWCWAMAQLGSGIPPANGSLQPLRAQPVSRQTSCTPRRAIHFRRDQRKHAWGDGALGRTGRWQTICRSPCPAGPSHVPRRGHPMRAVPLPQSGSHALPEIPLPRTLYFHRRGRGGMPSRHRYPARARRYGWDRMPSSPFAVASSAGGTKTSGSAAGTGLPRDSLKSDVRPDGK